MLKYHIPELSKTQKERDLLYVEDDANIIIPKRIRFFYQRACHQFEESRWSGDDFLRLRQNNCI